MLIIWVDRTKFDVITRQIAKVYRRSYFIGSAPRSPLHGRILLLCWRAVGKPVFTSRLYWAPVKTSFFWARPKTRKSARKFLVSGDAKIVSPNLVSWPNFFVPNQTSFWLKDGLVRKVFGFFGETILESYQKSSGRLSPVWLREKKSVWSSFGNDPM